MKCGNCGQEVTEKAKFCPKCGNRIESQNGPDSRLRDKKRNTSNKKGGRRWLIAAGVIILAAAGTAGGIALNTHMTKRAYEEAAADGSRYLEEMDYENAEASYLRAIDIDPKEKEPYLKLADIYLAGDKVAEAKEIISRAVQQVGEEDRAVVEELVEKWEKLSEYTWVVKPEVDVDNIYYLDNQQDTLSLNDFYKQKHSNWAIVEKNGSFGIIDMSGTLLTEINYSEIYNYGGICFLRSNTPIYIEQMGGEWDTFYFNEADEVVEPIHGSSGFYPQEYYYSNGIQNIYESIGWKYDAEPAGTIPVRQYSMEKGEDGKLKKGELLSAMYAIYTVGDLATDFIYNECGSESNSMLAVCKDDKWGYVTEKGEAVIPLEFDASWNEVINGENGKKPYCYGASEGYINLVKDGKWEMRDILNRQVIAPGVFEKILPVYEGKCWVKKDGKWGVIELENRNTFETDGALDKVAGMEETSEGTTGAVAADTDQSADLTKDEVMMLVTDHYNAVETNGGTYIILSAEVSETENGYSMMLRYQMSDEEAERIIASGGMPSANRLVGTADVNLQTGEVILDAGSEPDTWNLYE